MFVHWGVSSALGGEWQGKRYGGYAEHIQRALRIPIPVYREQVAGNFNPSNFNADAWMALAKQAGMGYFVITAKHHDGFAMYDSKVSRYNVVEATPFRRDPMQELRAAARKYGIRFGFYYSHAFDWGEENAPGNDWDYRNPGGDKLLGGADWWVRKSDFLPKARSYVDTKAIPQILELIRNYQPDLLWFDTPHKLPPDENLRIIAAVRAADPKLIMNSRVIQSNPELRNLADYISSTDKPAEFFPIEADWEGIPTTNESYGHSKVDRSHKPAGHFIRLLAKAVAKGGNILMNIGPMGDGTIEQVDADILHGIGRWMEANAQSIRGCGRTPLPQQGWGVVTRRDRTLYLHVFDWPKQGHLTVGGLKTPVKRASLLSNPSLALNAKTSGMLDVVITGLPSTAPDPDNSVIMLECESQPTGDQGRLLDSDQEDQRLHVFDGQICGGLRYGNGKSNTAHVMDWNQLEGAVSWPIRCKKDAVYEVTAVYDAPAPAKAKVVDGDAGQEHARAHTGAGGVFRISTSSGTKIDGKVQTGSHKQTVVGLLQVRPQDRNIKVMAQSIDGAELFRLQELRLRRVEHTP